MKSDTDLKLQRAAVEDFERVRESLHKVIVGMDPVIDALFWTMLSQGHAIFIGVPGLAKTLLISTLSKLCTLQFNRIQFTPDMMPSDLIGSEILEEDKTTGKRVFQFRKGPLFTQILLADEINRTPPKTQSALLQAMQERKISFAGQTHSLDQPFIVFATQNPIESEGTYALPEAQLDRFLISIPVLYPSVEEEMEVVRRTTSSQKFDLAPVLTGQALNQYQELVRRMPLDDSMVQLMVKIVRNSRPETQAIAGLQDSLRYGAGPRASQAIALGAKSRALLAGRAAVREEDIIAVAPYVLRHRLVLRRLRDQSAEQIVQRLIESAV